MALEIRQNLKLSQQLILTPQLQQSIKLLQLSRLELVDLIQQEMIENPVLEEVSEELELADSAAQHEEKATDPEKTEAAPESLVVDNTPEVMAEQDGQIKEPQDFDWENYLNTYNAPETIASGLDELPSYEQTLSEKPSLYEHLLWQLKLSNLSVEEEEAGEILISSLNEDGYLHESLSELSEKEKIPTERLERLLKIIQQFDPLGVAARSLKECLLLQIHLLGEHREKLVQLIEHHLLDLEKKDYKRIAREMKLSVEEIAALARLIQELEPRPGHAFQDSQAEYVTPDVYLYKVGGEWVVVLNEDGMPRLQISPFYRNLMGQIKQAAETREYIQTKFKSAVWLIRSIHQRQRTLYKVVTAIVRFQKDFFEHGVASLRPMILKDIAEEVGMHESTISRVTTQKYLHTPRGIYELKYFFNNGMPTREGSEIASESIKDKIRQLIGQEDPRAPLSDQEIAEFLVAGKIEIARRTVAKYREMMGILPSSKRKQLF